MSHATTCHVTHLSETESRARENRERAREHEQEPTTKRERKREGSLTHCIVSSRSNSYLTRLMNTGGKSWTKNEQESEKEVLHTENEREVLDIMLHYASQLQLYTCQDSCIWERKREGSLRQRKREGSLTYCIVFWPSIIYIYIYIYIYYIYIYIYIYMYTYTWQEPCIRERKRGKSLHEKRKRKREGSLTSKARVKPYTRVYAALLRVVCLIIVHDKITGLFCRI